MTTALLTVLKHADKDAAHVLCDHDDWDAMPHDAWVAYHSLHVLRDPAYLKFMTDKLQKYVDHSSGWASAMDAVAAAEMHRDCDVTSPESIVENLSKLTVQQLQIVGI
jgi:hypothetical protein